MDENKLEDLFDKLQIPINVQGYQLWKSFVEEYLEDDTQEMMYYYSKLAEKHMKTSYQVERSLRFAYKNSKDNIKDYFGVNYAITNGVLIRLFARECKRYEKKGEKNEDKTK